MSSAVPAATVIVLAKRPVAGRVKTRLVPPLSYHEAAQLAAAALRDTLAAVELSALDPAAVEFAAATDRVRTADRLLAFDGGPAGWLPAGWRYAAQPSGGLDVRLAAAFAAARPDAPAVLVGMDTPQVRPDHLHAFDATRYDACFGPATDGGFWLLGFADPAHARATVPGVVMSTSRTGAEQLDRLRRHGLRVQLLDELTDVDTIDSADEVAAAAPHTEFAATLAGIVTATRARA